VCVVFGLATGFIDSRLQIVISSLGSSASRPWTLNSVLSIHCQFPKLDVGRWSAEKCRRSGGNSENLCPWPCFVKYLHVQLSRCPQVGMMRKFRELLPPYFKRNDGSGRHPPLGARNSENVCSLGCWRSSLGDADVYRYATVGIPVQAKTSWETRASSPAPTVRARRGPKEIPRIFAPLALFRKILSCSVWLRRCAAVYKIAPRSEESPCTDVRDPEIGGMNGWPPRVHFPLITEAALT